VINHFAHQFQDGFLVGEGEYKTTILGTEGARVMGLEFDVDITPYYFPDLKYPKPPKKASSQLPGFDSEVAVQGIDDFLE